MATKLNEWFDPSNTIDIDNVNAIEYFRHLEEEYDEDEDGNLIDVNLYDIVLMDAQDERLKAYDGLTEEDLTDILGDSVARQIITSGPDRGYLQDIMSTTPDDIDDINSVNSIAKKLWPKIEYIVGARGYILPDGSLLHFGENTDHSSICWITGMTVGKFESLGNIRCGHDSFELEKRPTAAQKQSLRKLIAGHKERQYILISSNMPAPEHTVTTYHQVHSEHITHRLS